MYSPDVTAPSPNDTANYRRVDASAFMKGICFEAAFHYAGRVFVIRDSGQHGQFYNQVDATHLCRRPVTRYPFDFANGNALVGLWSVGRGCTARHDVIDVVRDNIGRHIIILLSFATEGSCNYELLRPFWVDLQGAEGYSVNIVVNQ